MYKYSDSDTEHFSKSTRAITAISMNVICINAANTGI